MRFRHGKGTYFTCTHAFQLKHTRTHARTTHTHTLTIMTFVHFWYGGTANTACMKEIVHWIYAFHIYYISFYLFPVEDSIVGRRANRKKKKRIENSVEIKSGSNQCINNKNIYIPNHLTNQPSSTIRERAKKPNEVVSSKVSVFHMKSIEKKKFWMRKILPIQKVQKPIKFIPATKTHRKKLSVKM